MGLWQLHGTLTGIGGRSNHPCPLLQEQEEIVHLCLLVVRDYSVPLGTGDAPDLFSTIH